MIAVNAYSGPTIAPLSSIDNQSRAAIESVQRLRLQALLGVVHGRLFSDPYEELGRQPVMTPSQLRRTCPPFSSQLLLPDAEQGVVLRSSGTSGGRKVMYHSWAFVQQVAQVGARGVRSALPQPPRRIANVLAPAELNGGFLFVQDIARELQVQAFPLGTTLTSEEILEVMAEHRIDTLVAVPDRLVALLTHPAASEVIPHLRTCLYIGEALGDTRSELLRGHAPGVLVRSLSYSTSETGPIGYQCVWQAEGRHHVHEDVVFVEVVDPETGRRVDDEEEGDVVVTVLATSGMPLVRYAVGDRGVMHPAGQCVCGSATRELTLLGRTPESFNLDSTTISEELVVECLEPFGVQGRDDCQVVVERYPDQTFTVTFLVESARIPENRVEDVLPALSTEYHLRRFLTTEGCRGAQVRRLPRAEFHATSRGKVPFFLEHPSEKRALHE